MEAKLYYSQLMLQHEASPFIVSPRLLMRSSSMAFAGCWPSSSNTRLKSIMIKPGQQFPRITWKYLQQTGSFIHEWTPFLLVTSYFTFSICLYMFCSAALIDMFWFLYLITNFYIAGSAALEAVMSLGPCRDARVALRSVQENDWMFPTSNQDLVFLDLLIVSGYMSADSSVRIYGTHINQVAYLPNEAEIIMDRVHYALDEIVYPREKIKINLVYNTPIPIEPLETELSNLALRKACFRSIKVPGSTSKADNLNYFFSLNIKSDITAIFDADHYPHPHGPRWAAERFMQDPKTDLVQGRCIIFNSTSSWLSAMISVEFDKIYAVSHPGRAFLWGFGVFTGSNGYWRTPLLHKMQMDGTVLTEDIDSAIRAIGEEDAKIIHDLNVTSYELAPTSIPALWKQRLRWAQGWTQVSLHHCSLTFTKSKGCNRSLKTRIGLLFLLLIREFSYYLVTQYLCLILSLLFTNFPKSARALADVLFFPFAVSQWLFVIRYFPLVRLVTSSGTSHR